MNSRVQESRQNLKALDSELIDCLCKALLTELGEGETTLEQQASEYLMKGDYDSAKQCCLQEPTNCFLAAISCISSAYRSPMVADSVLRDAARHTTEVAKRKAESRINQAFTQIFKTNH
jgi:hypothetical protein